jgi:hypothetical protein
MGSVANEVLFDLNDQWRLGFDDLQWIVMRKNGKHCNAEYRPVSFIASNKLVLMRVLDDLDVAPTDAANTHLAWLPESYRAFKTARERGDHHG